MIIYRCFQTGEQRITLSHILWEKILEISKQKSDLISNDSNIEKLNELEKQLKQDKDSDDISKRARKILLKYYSQDHSSSAIFKVSDPID
jgi:hypothetical protein